MVYRTVCRVWPCEIVNRVPLGFGDMSFQPCTYMYSNSTAANHLHSSASSNSIVWLLYGPRAHKAGRKDQAVNEQGCESLPDYREHPLSVGNRHGALSIVTGSTVVRAANRTIKGPVSSLPIVLTVELIGLARSREVGDGRLVACVHISL
ncbi:hypothetical protein BT63DRAFT_145218 [Microthyrium microscopicum]|uniref:Uncharacterized protein n=1 Tax=Microthyrium microscopicum TaxID=703497 RepID=A0A6A6UMW4_9PEZI|nr:hypothetical protein BT63DRAFT_145218 [Microthyrium microscopicum]